MKRKSPPTWKQVLTKMEAGKLCTNDQDYKWFYSCYKAYMNPDKQIDNREKWFKNITERFQEILNNQFNNQ